MIGALWLSLSLLMQGDGPATSATFAQPVEGISIRAQPEPPIDRDLLLSISDERLLSDGQTVRFQQTQRIRFSRAATGGWLVQMEQRQLECAGPDSVCAAYRQMLSPRAEMIRQFHLDRQGMISPHGVSAPIAAPDEGLPGANAALIVAYAENTNPGMLETGELREALQFVGFDSSQPTDDLAGELLSVSQQADGRIAVHIRRVINPVGSDARLQQDQHSLVDPASGLLLDSRTETLMIANGDAGLRIGTRHWQLGEIAAP